MNTHCNAFKLEFIQKVTFPSEWNYYSVSDLAEHSAEKWYGWEQGL